MDYTLGEVIIGKYNKLFPTENVAMEKLSFGEYQNFISEVQKLKE
jgi:hypothetical protein